MKNILHNRLFLFGIAIKLLLIIFLTPSPNTMGGGFIPFIENAANFSNSYAVFVNTDSFPYPALMLYIFAFAKLILFFIPTVITMKIVIFIADFLIFKILIQWINNKKKEVIYLYWLSPLTIYINYIHGQLDIIPILFLMVSINYIFKNKYLVSMLFFGLSLSTKTSMILALPFILVFYYFRKKYLKSMFFYVFVVFITFFLINLPFIGSLSFYNMVFNNSAQQKLFEVVLNYGSSGDLNVTHIYLAVFFYLIVLFQAIYIKIKTYDIFILFISFAFGIILIFVNPMPGWFYWIIPFWVYFFAQSSTRSQLFFLLMQISFLCYYFVVPYSDYLMVLPDSIKNMISYNTLYEYISSLEINSQNYAYKIIDLFFTISLFSLVVNVFYIYRRGVENYSKYKVISKPVLIGIGGNSGVGKSRIANALTMLFGSSNVINIKGDDVHKWERGNENWNIYTHLDPKANDLYYDYNQLLKLKSGKSVKRRHYDHKTGKFIYDIVVKPNNIILYDGLHPYYIKQMRNIFDLKIFISPDLMLAKYWKIQRDIKYRGYSIEKVLEQIEMRMNDYSAYIAPQEKVADIIISVKPVKKMSNDDLFGQEPETMLSIKVCNSIYLEPFINRINNIKSIKVDYKYIDFDFQEVQIFGCASANEIQEIGNQFSINSYGFDEPEYKDENAGIIQLLVLYYIFEVLDNEKY